jgi:hypothetical protein
MNGRWNALYGSSYPTTAFRGLFGTVVREEKQARLAAAQTRLGSNGIEEEEAVKRTRVCRRYSFCWSPAHGFPDGRDDQCHYGTCSCKQSMGQTGRVSGDILSYGWASPDCRTCNRHGVGVEGVLSARTYRLNR